MCYNNIENRGCEFNRSQINTQTLLFESYSERYVILENLILFRTSQPRNTFNTAAFTFMRNRKKPEHFCSGFLNAENKLFCAENSVACIAQTGANVCVFVKLTVKTADIKLNIGVRLHKSVNTLGSCDD